MKATNKPVESAPLGAALRDARLAKGATPGEAAAATRIKVQIIEAIERDDFSRIAAPTYARGFIKLYAEYVGLDPEPLVRAYVERHVPAGSPRDGSQKALRPPARKKPAAASQPSPRWIDTLPLPRVAARVALAAGGLVAAVLVFMSLIRMMSGADAAPNGKAAPSRPPDTAWQLVAEPPDPYLPLPTERERNP